MTEPDKKKTVHIHYGKKELAGGEPYRLFDKISLTKPASKKDSIDEQLRRAAKSA